MTIAIIHLCPPDILRHMFFTKEKVPMARDNFNRYSACKPIETDATGEAAADEMFDLTNNPSRQEEREEKYGRGRSVSSGDVIEVDGVRYLCMSIGWERL